MLTFVKEIGFIDGQKFWSGALGEGASKAQGDKTLGIQRLLKKEKGGTLGRLGYGVEDNGGREEVFFRWLK